MSQRLIAVCIAGPLALILGGIALAVPLPYASYSPGPTFDILGKDVNDAEVIQVDGHQAYYDKGQAPVHDRGRVVVRAEGDPRRRADSLGRPRQGGRALRRGPPQGPVRGAGGGRRRGPDDHLPGHREGGRAQGDRHRPADRRPGRLRRPEGPGEEQPARARHLQGGRWPAGHHPRPDRRRGEEAQGPHQRRVPHRAGQEGDSPSG
ncbi:hypothetical protein [Nocardioides convexus]|uniref:hypothetical protein n=1 Tax=Nocardioides convexus TaxID=2712224 RepID=UPI0031013965